jgi:hypothetical protein
MLYLQQEKSTVKEAISVYNNTIEKRLVFSGLNKVIASNYNNLALCLLELVLNHWEKGENIRKDLRSALETSWIMNNKLKNVKNAEFPPYEFNKILDEFFEELERCDFTTERKNFWRLKIANLKEKY